MEDNSPVHDVVSQILIIETHAQLAGIRQSKFCVLNTKKTDIESSEIKDSAMNSYIFGEILGGVLPPLCCLQLF